MAKRATPRSTAEKPVVASSTKEQKLRGQTLRLNEAEWKALKMLAFEQGVTAHSLLIEGVHLVFERYGKRPVA